MKLEYKAIGSASWTTLGSEADRSATVELFAPGFNFNVQVEPLFRSPNSFKADRQNVGVPLHIVISKPYAMRAAALAACRTLPFDLSGGIHLRATQDTEIQYYPNAMLQSAMPNLRGLTVQWDLTFTTDKVTLEEP